MPSDIATALAAAFAGALAGVALGWLLVRPRAGEPALLDAVFEHLRSPLALAAVPVPALLTGNAAGLATLLAVTAFTPLFLYTFASRRGAGPHLPAVLRGAGAALLLVAGVAAGAIAFA